MASLSVNLPCPSGNGAGASVDLSAFGLTKTFVVNGIKTCNVNIEMNDATNPADGSWAPVVSFQLSGSTTLAIAGKWFRARVSAYFTGTPSVNVGGNDEGTTLLDLPVPAGAGAGAAVDVSGLPESKTIQIGGTFVGPLAVEISTDGSTEWAQVTTFAKPGQRSFVASANWARITRALPGTGGPLSGTPIAILAGAADTGGGGGGGSIDVQNNGSDLGAFTTLDISGGNPVDMGGGAVRIGMSIAPYVYRPGGLAAGNVFVDWPTLNDALANAQGLRVIQFDDSAMGIAIPSGSWDMTDVLWIGTEHADGTNTSVDLEDNTVRLPGLTKTGKFLTLNNTHGTAPIQNQHTIYEIDGTHILGPYFAFTDAGPATFNLHDGAILGTGAVVTTGADTITINVDGAFATVQANAVSNTDGGFAGAINFTSWQTVSMTQENAPESWTFRSLGGDFAMANVGDSEGPILISGSNIASIDYDGTTLHLVLTNAVPNVDNVALSATLRSRSSAVNTITATMDIPTRIDINITNETGDPTFAGFYVRLALMP